MRKIRRKSKFLVIFTIHQLIVFTISGEEPDSELSSPKNTIISAEKLVYNHSQIGEQLVDIIKKEGIQFSEEGIRAALLIAELNYSAGIDILIDRVDLLPPIWLSIEHETRSPVETYPCAKALYIFGDSSLQKVLKAFLKEPKENLRRKHCFKSIICDYSRKSILPSLLINHYLSIEEDTDRKKDLEMMHRIVKKRQINSE